MRTKTALLALVTIAASALPLGAAQAQAKIGVVNVARLLQEAPQAQAAQQALENEFAARKRDLQNTERDLKAREDKLQKDGATMAEAERRNQEKALRDGQRDFARKQNEFMEDLNVRRNEALGQLQRDDPRGSADLRQERRPRRRHLGGALREPVDRRHQPGAGGAAGEGQGPGREVTQAPSQRSRIPCRCAWANWRCDSAATCRATPTSSSTGSPRCRMRGPARCPSSPTPSTASISRAPVRRPSCSTPRAPRSARPTR